MITPWPSASGRSTPTVSAAELAQFETRTTALLQSLWPYPGQKITWDPDPNAAWPDLNYKISTPHGEITLVVYYYTTFGSPFPGDPTTGWHADVMEGSAGVPTVTRTQDGRIIIEGITQGTKMVSVETSMNGDNILTFAGSGPVDELGKAQWTAFGSSPRLLSLYQDAVQLGLEPS